MLKFPNQFIIQPLKDGGGGDTPTGTIPITSNGLYDVSSYANANVNVSTSSDSCIDYIKGTIEDDLNNFLSLSGYSTTGSPTEDAGIVTITKNTEQWITSNPEINFADYDSWIILTRINISNFGDYSDNGLMGQSIFGNKFCINSYIHKTPNILHFELSSDGVNFDIGDLTSSALSTNTWYYIKLEFTGSAYNLYCGTTLNNLELKSTIKTSTRVYSSIGHYIWGKDETSDNRARVSAKYDMNECQIYTNYGLYWQGITNDLTYLINYDIEGSPTISDYIFTNTDTSSSRPTDFVSMNKLFTVNDSNWTIKLKLNSLSGTLSQGGHHTLFGYCGTDDSKRWTLPLVWLGNSDYGNQSKAYLFLSSNGNSWDIASDVAGTYDYTGNEYIKLTFNGSSYIVSYSTDDETYIDDITVTSSTAIYNNTETPLSIGAYYGAQGNTIKGSIDLIDTKVYINNELYWEALVLNI